MALPGITPAADTRAITERLAVLIRDYNRADAMVPLYAADTGSATAYVIAPVPGIKAYSVGQLFAFKATNANSGTTPTLAVNGLTAGTIKLPGGGAVAANDIAAGGMTLVQVQDVTGGTPTFNLLNPCASPVPSIPATNTGATTYLTSTVNLNNTANFFDVVNTGSIGASGQSYLISGNCVVRDTAGAANITLEITDGTTVYVSSALGTQLASFEVNWAFSVAVSLTGAATFKIRARDSTSTSGQAIPTTAVVGGTTNKATYITYARLT